MKWNLIKNVNVWCFSPFILEVDAVDAVFGQTLKFTTAQLESCTYVEQF